MAGRLVRKLAERDCYSLGENDTLKTASEALAKNNLGAMPILASSGKVIGIISERDIARKIHQENFSNNVIGLSDHENGIDAAPIAYLLGARVFEKHFTLERSSKGTDHSFSLEPQGLSKLSRNLRRIPIQE